MKKIDEMCNMFGIKNPYERLRNTILTPNIIGWNGIPKTVLERINILSPKIIVEVGSFLGHSAIIMGEHIKCNRKDFLILCIDTWLGSAEHWRKDQCNMLNLFDFYGNGTSVLYDQFLKNILSKELNEYVLPLPCTSLTGAELLAHHKIEADVIYIDGDHTESQAYMDIKTYYPLLKDNGLMFGDDFPWESVRKALQRFCGEAGLGYEVVNGIFWKIL